MNYIINYNIINYNIIVATCEDNGIGKDNNLPWSKNPEDMRNFSKLTRGNGNNAIIMGKNTYKNIGRPLPCRTNIVLSSSLNEKTEEKNIHVFKTIDECTKFCTDKNFDEVWVIGGESIYRQFLDLDYIQKIYKTNINKKIECDTFFPIIPEEFYLTKNLTLSQSVILSVWCKGTLSLYK
jgi:dihydrofolate reductase